MVRPVEPAKRKSVDAKTIERPIDRRSGVRLSARAAESCKELYFDLDTLQKTGVKGRFEAGECFDKAGHLGGAISVFAGLLEDFPYSEYSRRALLRVALLYEEVEGVRTNGKSYLSREAARHFSAYSERYARDANAIPALMRALCIYFDLRAHEELGSATLRLKELRGVDVDPAELCAGEPPPLHSH
jgi:hypothetical protein